MASQSKRKRNFQKRTEVAERLKKINEERFQSLSGLKAVATSQIREITQLFRQFVPEVAPKDPHPKGEGQDKPSVSGEVSVGVATPIEGLEEDPDRLLADAIQQLKEAIKGGG